VATVRGDNMPEIYIHAVKGARSIRSARS
jgi:hypothetical protein